MSTDKKLIIALPHGFCAGVLRAIEVAETALRLFPRPVYCLKEIVHNRQVVDALAEKGIVFVQTLDEVPEGATVLFSAHGVAPSVRSQAAGRRLKVLDATCPFVTKVHNEVRRYAEKDYSIILVGHRTHDEIIGVAGEAPGKVRVVETFADAENVAVDDASHVAVVTQTTLSMYETTRTLDLLRRRFPSMSTPPTSDICYATTNRQKAAASVARESDMMLVLGSANSSNSKRLVEVASVSGCHAKLVVDMKQLEKCDFSGVRVLGLTAGASTPESFVLEAVAFLKSAGFNRVEDRLIEREDMHFPLPEAVRGHGEDGG